MFLYIRMGIATLVSLYTSRVVLQQLGIDGYGTYTLVAGIVTFWTFLSRSMSTAGARYLAVAIGSGTIEERKHTFSSNFMSHLALAGIIFFLTETVGLWFVNAKLELADNVIFSANVVYQCSVIMIVTSIISVPFNSLIIAHESMNIYAKYEIISSCLNLLTALTLILIPGNKLEIYAILLLLSSLIVTFLYVRFSFTHFRSDIAFRSFSPKRVREIFSFTSWDLFCNGAVSLRHQGTAVIYKWFVGTAVNAALGICMSVQAIVTTFANNLATAVRPQIIKTYAAGNYTYMQTLVTSGSKLMSYLILLLIVPIICEIDFILHIWLSEVPPHTSGFVRLTIIGTYCWSFTSTLHTTIHATGRVKSYSIVSGIMVLSELGVVYGLFFLSRDVYIPQYLRVIVITILGFVMLHYIKKYIPEFNVRQYIREIYGKGLVSILLCFILPLTVCYFMQDGWARLCIIIPLSMCTTTFIVWHISFTPLEQAKVKEIVSSFIARFRKRVQPQ